MNRSGGLRWFLWHLYEYLAMACGLGSLVIICLLWLPIAFLLNPVLPRRLATPFGRQGIRWGMRLYLGILQTCCACRFDLSAVDQLRHEGPLILVANHPSLLDALLILSRLPTAVCIMKASLLNNILFGSATRMAGYIPNNPAITMITRAREELNAGAHLILFPEGTRTSHAPIDACMPTTGLIAGRTKVPVQTLLIEFSSPYLGKAWPLFRPAALPLSCRIRLGRRFPPPGNVAVFTRELEAYFRSELAPFSRSTAVI